MKRWILATSAFVAGVAVTVAYSARAGSPGAPQAASTGSAAPEDADREAILKTARDFADAFNKRDAKAIAGMYTENAEAREADGRTHVGRAAIEKSYADLFKAVTDAKVEVLVKSVRFPAKDLAIEEGLLRLTRGEKDLPATTSYVAVHAREAGRWKMALTSEAGVGLDRLEDLDWLLGTWTTKVKGDDVRLTFVRDAKKSVITGSFTKTAAGKEPVTGSIRIALDPETGRIRSWGFEDDGAHSQSLWHCDGKSWVLDARGVLADGTPTAERIVLLRAAPDVITWRAIDRVLGDTHLADTPPMRLTRLAPSK